LLLWRGPLLPPTDDNVVSFNQIQTAISVAAKATVTVDIQ
jgi:hypothetical protein